nr:MAG TPA: hypothetical protein [Caudoviricetes sp.]
MQEPINSLSKKNEASIMSHITVNFQLQFIRI